MPLADQLHPALPGRPLSRPTCSWAWSLGWSCALAGSWFLGDRAVALLGVHGTSGSASS
ncbi:MAG: hypothetical protein MZV63_46635 [Marinilabiliales bacterium]|nr:hypothetical protein [Marinilabiliales bacterium]